MEREPSRLTVNELLKLLEENRIESQDILDSLKRRISQVDPRLKAYVRYEPQASYASYLAPSTDKKQLLRAIPVTIKDNICTCGYPTECCSKILEGFVPPYDATVIKKLKEEGAVIFPVKTNMDEFAFGSSTETSYFGQTHNPWNLQCVPGGSSGGSAAAVAADEAIAALGSDTGGSIRQPAAFCGVVGLKPTYGLVSRFGLIAFASSLDVIGPITKSVADSALLLNVIAGADPQDSTCVQRGRTDYTQSLINDIKGIRIGIPREYFVEGIDPEVKEKLTQAIERLKELGAQIQEISLPHTKYAVAVYYIIATAEASSNLARFDGVGFGFRAESESLTSNIIEMYKKTRAKAFSEEAKRRILLGAFVLSYGYYDAYYLRAQKVRTLIKRDFDEVFSSVDCIITPTSPSAAFKSGEKVNDPLKMYLSDIYTISANLAGIPAISIPCGFTNNGLPVGMQILTKSFNEEQLFRVAYTYEQNTDWHLMKPKL